MLSSTNALKLFIHVYALFLNIELVSDIFVENKFLIQIRYNIEKLITNAQLKIPKDLSTYCMQPDSYVKIC